MGRPIVKLAEHYIEWSTISDSPTTFGLTLDELQAHVKEERGNDGLLDLHRRLERVEATGTSAYNDESADDTIWLNRAGPKETILHLEEIIEFYVRRKVEPTAKTLAAFRKGLPRCGPSCVQIERNGCAGWCRDCWGTDYVRPRATDSVGPAPKEKT